MNLENKYILVTGGSRGIGAAIVKELAQKGAKVCFTYASSKETAEQLLATLPNSKNHRILPLQLTSEESIENCIAELMKEWPQIDGLVNNAGLTKDTLLLRMKADDFDQVIHANLRGSFLVTRSVIKLMLKARKGSVVTITSVIGQTGNAGQANYAASKAGLEAFTKSIAQEVASRSIRLNCVAPGFIETDMTNALSDAQKTAILSKVPMQRMAKPEEVAHVVSFLLSDDTSYITGQTLGVNGGLYM